MFPLRRYPGASPISLLVCPLSLLAAAILVAGAASGCGGARPARYYELSSPTPVSAAGSNPYPISLLVGHIAAPVILRDDRLVYRTGPVQMGIYDDQRWSEPPTEMIESMLVRTLRDSARFRSVEYARSHARAEYMLRGRLTHLEEVDEGDSVKANVELSLELFQNSTAETVWSQTYAHAEPVQTKSIAAVVEALDRNVQQGIHQLSSEILQYFANNPPK